MIAMRTFGIAIVSAILLAMASALPVRAQELAAGNEMPMTVDHSAWDRILAKYVAASPDCINRVAYGRVTAADKKALKAYLTALQRVTPSALPADEGHAYWINLYNALTIDVVLDHYPVKSIRDIAISPGLFAVGPWKKALVSVEGKKLSLDNIEHDILRKTWADPRVHYAVNCAAIGCPNLMAKAFTAKALDEMLDRGARHYAAPGLKKQLSGVDRIGGYDYDWSLNEAK